MTNQELTQTIFDLLGQIAPEADASTLEPDEDMRAALDIDSFDFLNFLIGLNEATGVEIQRQTTASSRPSTRSSPMSRQGADKTQT